ncbi:ArnT family glycosyltransferase [Bdellovibrio sp. HCB337]|uniref:ArnT family glycosyltransferase n=1 Tax=Bdellovibrio sp. HCB337 TaxID=3394358 RepID=UPI0039A600D1
MRQFLQIWILSLIFKIGLAAILPLSPDESYYWMWSHHMQLSYFDHPPFVAWLFYLGHWLEPWGQLVRLPTVLLGHLTFLVWYFILKPQFTWDKFKYWYAIAFFSPLVGFGSMVGTPDVPLLLFWSLAIYFFQQCLLNQKTRDYFLLGASLGLGFCSKYHIVLFVPFIVLYLFFEKRWHEVLWRKLAFTFIGGLLCSLPVIIWNIQNEFASFRFQIDHGLGKTNWTPDWTLGYIVAELILLFPLVVYAALRTRIPKDYKFLPYLGWGPLIFFFFSSFRGTVELNWPNVAFPVVFALVLFNKNPRRVALWTSAFWILFYAFGFYSALFFPKNSPTAKPFREQFRFLPLASLQKEYQPLYAGTYQIASTIWYQNKTPIYKLRDMSRYDFYDTLPQSLPQEDSFYLIQENWSQIPDWVKKAGYTVSVVKEVEPHFLVVKVSK